MVTAPWPADGRVVRGTGGGLGRSARYGPALRAARCRGSGSGGGVAGVVRWDARRRWAGLGRDALWSPDTDALIGVFVPSVVRAVVGAGGRGTHPRSAPARWRGTVPGRQVSPAAEPEPEPLPIAVAARCHHGRPAAPPGRAVWPRRPAAPPAKSPRRALRSRCSAGRSPGHGARRGGAAQVGASAWFQPVRPCRSGRVSPGRRGAQPRIRRPRWSRTPPSRVVAVVRREVERAGDEVCGVPEPVSFRGGALSGVEPAAGGVAAGTGSGT